MDHDPKRLAAIRRLLALRDAYLRRQEWHADLRAQDAQRAKLPIWRESGLGLASYIDRIVAADQASGEASAIRRDLAAIETITEIEYRVPGDRGTFVARAVGGPMGETIETVRSGRSGGSIVSRAPSITEGHDRLRRARESASRLAHGLRTVARADALDRHETAVGPRMRADTDGRSVIYCPDTPETRAAAGFVQRELRQGCEIIAGGRSAPTVVATDVETKCTRKRKRRGCKGGRRHRRVS